MNPDVSGHCPMGCGPTLFLAASGAIMCGHDDCRRPDAVAVLLADPETEHVVTFDDVGFIVKHPLRERIGDALLTCQLHSYCANLAVRPRGVYRVIANTDGRGAWRFTSQDAT